MIILTCTIVCDECNNTQETDVKVDLVLHDDYVLSPRGEWRYSDITDRLLCLECYLKEKEKPHEHLFNDVCFCESCRGEVRR